MDKTEIVNVRMKSELKKQLSDHANEIGLDMSSFIRMAIIEMMKKK